MSLQDRLRKMEENIPPVTVCPECGREALRSIGFQRHHEDGVVVRGHRPCESCEKIAPKSDSIKLVTVHSTDCWCEGNPEKAAAAHGHGTVGEPACEPA